VVGEQPDVWERPAVQVVDHDDGHIGIVASDVAVLLVDFGFVALGLALPLETLETTGTHGGAEKVA
jgi:hypothetical protein